MDEERALFASVENAAPIVAEAGTINVLLNEVEQMVPNINDFFDNVLVMDKDTAVKENRLAILQMISGSPTGIADLSQLEGF